MKKFLIDTTQSTSITLSAQKNHKRRRLWSEFICFVLISGTPCFDKWIDPVTGVCTCDEGMFGDNCQGKSKLSILYVACLFVCLFVCLGWRQGEADELNCNPLQRVQGFSLWRAIQYVFSLLKYS